MVVLDNDMMVTILQYMSNKHTIHFKHILCQMSVISHEAGK